MAFELNIELLSPKEKPLHRNIDLFQNDVDKKFSQNKEKGYLRM
jgi:hypothetical protein